MTKSELLDIIGCPSSIDKDILHDLQDYVKEYPYSPTFRMLYLKGLDNVQDVRYGNELKTTSLYVTDRRNLYRFISNKPQTAVQDKRQLTPMEQPQVAEIDEKQEAVVAPKENVAPIVDIQSYLEGKADDSLSNLAISINEKPKAQLKHQDLIDNFLQASESSDIYVRMGKPEEKEEPKTEVSKPMEDGKGEPEEFFTETLARIYIKQHKFDKAIKIFKRLSLKYPEKSIYFADQIRFFEKLIQNYKIKK